MITTWTKNLINSILPFKSLSPIIKDPVIEEQLVDESAHDSEESTVGTEIQKPEEDQKKVGRRITVITKTRAPFQLVGKKDIEVSGAKFDKGTDGCIRLYNCENILIRRSEFYRCLDGITIFMERCKNVLVEDNYFEEIHSGFEAVICENVRFNNNSVKNVVGKRVKENGQMIDVGTMAQFKYCHGAGNSISYNAYDGIEGVSMPIDIINLFGCKGEPDSPIMIKGNWLRGGGSHKSGGGINIGDGGGSYQIAEDNILVDVGQYGLGISGGNNMILRNNKVYGKRKPYTNVGITACNWYEEYPEAGKSYNIEISNNEINYTNKDGAAGKSWWVYKNMGKVKGMETNKYNPGLNASILPKEIL